MISILNMSMDKYYGFVYLWYDTKFNRFIIGSHHGQITDKYTTSTGGKHVRNIFKNRPKTMKRRILEYNYIDSSVITRQIEQKWLDMRPGIAEDKRYYNISQVANGWDKERMKEINRQRIIDGTHQFLGGEIQRASNLRRVDAGIHNFQSVTHRESISKIAKQRCEDGTHHFCNSEFNKIPFKLVCSDGREWIFDSKVDAVRAGIKPGVVDNVKQVGSYYFKRGSKKGDIKFTQGTTLMYYEIDKGK